MKSRERDCSQGFNYGTVVAIKVASARAGLLPATRYVSHSLREWKTGCAHSARKLPRREKKARSGDSSFWKSMHNHGYCFSAVEEGAHAEWALLLKGSQMGACAQVPRVHRMGLFPLLSPECNCVWVLWSFQRIREEVGGGHGTSNTDPSHNGNYDEKHCKD